jgi:hypothetical protein
LAGSIAVSRGAGGTVADWQNLGRWFITTPAGPSRLDRLRLDAIAAIRTLTLNLTRLSSVGLGLTSRRADLLRLAAAFAECGTDPEAHRLAGAAFGLFASSHLGRLAGDDADPVGTSKPWADAPRALVPLSLRERGDTTNRGSATPVRDRSREQLLVLRRREHERAAAQRVDDELLALERLDGATVSAPALARLQQVLGRTTFRRPDEHGCRQALDGEIRCQVRRLAGAATTVHSPHGTLTLHGLDVSLSPVGSEREGAAVTGAANPQVAVELRDAARHLLQHPLTCGAEDEADREMFVLIRRHEHELDRWFTQRLGYRLQVGSDTARLYKSGYVPAARSTSSSTRCSPSCSVA